jgi:hypothetical protein
MPGAWQKTPVRRDSKGLPQWGMLFPNSYWEKRTMSRRSKELRDHPFRPGQDVTIFGFGHFRRPSIEGRARIVAPVHGIPDFYRVRFEGERRIRERLAHPGAWQTEPDRLLTQLIAEWRQSLTPELLREFFPEDVCRDEESSQ